MYDKTLRASAWEASRSRDGQRNLGFLRTVPELIQRYLSAVYNYCE